MPIKGERGSLSRQSTPVDLGGKETMDRNAEVTEELLAKLRGAKPKPKSQTIRTEKPEKHEDHYWVGFLAATVSYMLDAPTLSESLKIGAHNLKLFIEAYEYEKMDDPERDLVFSSITGAEERLGWH